MEDPTKNLTQSVRAKRELSPKEKKVAQSLENLPALTLHDKMDLLLVWRKLKTAMQLSLPVADSGRNGQEIEARIRKAGLLFKDSGAEIKTSGRNAQRICFIANNQNDLDLIFEVWFGDHVRDSRVYREMGRMSGFPKEAIEIYDKFTKLPGRQREDMRKKLTLSEKEKKELFLADLYPFSKFFYMSREHWRNELEVIRKWAEEIKLVAPTLYQLLIDQYGN